MIEPQGLWALDVAPFLSPRVTAHIASEPWQIDAYYRLRREIFAEEQALFERSDIDDNDAVATPIVAVGHIAGMPDDVIGAVRIYPAGGATWFGGRLGVTRSHRSRRVVGSTLIRAAVETAHAWGCARFLATVQVRNVPYFEQNHFATVEPVVVCGQPHHLMAADLAAYPARAAVSGTPVEGQSHLADRARAIAA